jgi:hypothetical protein
MEPELASIESIDNSQNDRSTLNLIYNVKSTMEDTSDVSQQPSFQHIRTGKLKLHQNTTTALTHIHDDITHTQSPLHAALSSHKLASHIILLK